MGKASTEIQCLNEVGTAQSSPRTCTFKIVIKMPIIWFNKQQVETGNLFIWEASLMKVNLQNRTMKICDRSLYKILNRLIYTVIHIIMSFSVFRNHFENKTNQAFWRFVFSSLVLRLFLVHLAIFISHHVHFCMITFLNVS